MIRISKALIALLWLTLSYQLSAHHNSTPHFDTEKEIVIEGTITQLRLVNPHAYLYFEEEVNGEMVGWRCELSAATQLKRFGWTTEMFPEGGKITVTGAPARREDNVCFLNSVKFEDGSTLGRRTDLTETASSTPANTAPTTSERPEFLENGLPNLSGHWISKSFGRRGEGIRARYLATEAGSAAAAGYEVAFDDPILRCHPVNIFSGWNHDSNINQIIQNDGSITLLYGFMDFVRTIHLDMDEHPENITPSTAGHSIGKWEDNVLVVDTIGFEEGILSRANGMRHSDQMHAVERFYFDPEREYLVRNYRVVDPLYLEGETVGEDYMAISDSPYTPYECVELSGKNNIRPSELPTE